MAFFVSLLWIGILLIYVWLIVASNQYATRMGYSNVGYLFLAIFGTPIILLLVIYMQGETDEHRKKRIIEEEAWRRGENIEVAKEEQDKDITDVMLS